MNAHTHILGGLAAAGVAISVGVPHPIVMATASGFGGLLPDWDHPYSAIGRWVPWPRLVRSRGPHIPPEVGRRGWPHPIWHRHQGHSLVGAAVESLITVGLLIIALGIVGHFIHHGIGVPYECVFGGLFLGALSHLMLDAFNEAPQWWLWPFTQKGFRWPVHASVKRLDGPVSVALTLAILLLAWHVGHFPLAH